MQPTPPGWYWDPGNRPGLFRWWDGGTWTEHTTVNRRTEPPYSPPPAGPDPDGRYRAAGLSYPALDSPWRRGPGYVDLVDVVAQELVVGRTPRGPYIAGVFIGGLPERYGYAGTDDLDRVGEAFTDAMLSTYYPHETPRDRVRPVTERLDGRTAWRATVAMEVDDPSLDFIREDALFVIVDFDGRAGVCYASLPDVAGVPPIATAAGDLGLAVTGRTGPAADRDR